jgi:hypothetical protein
MVTMQALTSGLALGLAIPLAVAAAAKTRDRPDFEHTLVGALPPAVWRRGLDSRRLAVAWIVVEAAVAAALIAVPARLGPVAAIAAAATTGVFVPAAAVAVVRGMPCHCLGRASRRAGRGGLVGAVLLLLVAGALLGAVLAGNRLGAAYHLSGTAWAIASGVAVAWFLLVARLRGGAAPHRDRAAELRLVDEEVPEHRAYRRLVLDVAERDGPLADSVVHCLRGTWFGEPRRTPAACAHRLGLPVSTVQLTYDRVMRHAEAAWRTRPESGRLQERKRALREAATKRPRNTTADRKGTSPAEGGGR